jgi:hypothetical protein
LLWSQRHTPWLLSIVHCAEPKSGTTLPASPASRRLRLGTAATPCDRRHFGDPPNSVIIRRLVPKMREATGIAQSAETMLLEIQTEFRPETVRA